MIHAICCVDDFGFEDKKQSVPHILNALYKSNIFHHESKSISIGAGRELFPKILYSLYKFRNYAAKLVFLLEIKLYYLMQGLLLEQNKLIFVILN